MLAGGATPATGFAIIVDASMARENARRVQLVITVRTQSGGSFQVERMSVFNPRRGPSRIGCGVMMLKVKLCPSHELRC